MHIKLYTYRTLLITLIVNIKTNQNKNDMSIHIHQPNIKVHTFLMALITTHFYFKNEYFLKSLTYVKYCTNTSCVLTNLIFKTILYIDTITISIFQMRKLRSKEIK